MADEYQTSNELAGILNKDENVIYRGRVLITTTGQGAGSIYAPYYIAEYSKSIKFLNIDAIRPRVEVWVALEQATAPFTGFKKCPFTTVEAGTKNVSRNIQVEINQTGSKTTGFDLLLTIRFFSIAQGAKGMFFITIYNETIASVDGTLYENLGSSS